MIDDFPLLHPRIGAEVDENAMIEENKT